MATVLVNVLIGFVTTALGILAVVFIFNRYSGRNVATLGIPTGAAAGAVG